MFIYFLKATHSNAKSEQSSEELRFQETCYGDKTVEKRNNALGLLRCDLWKYIPLKKPVSKIQIAKTLSIENGYRIGSELEGSERFMVN